MAKERGLIRMILKEFIKSITPKFPKRICAGEDYYGTKYYETARPKGARFARPVRYFEPVNKNDFEQEIPAEWEAWLRYRRNTPPTEEEVNQNYQMMIEKKKNADEIEASYAEKKTDALLDSVKPATEHSSISFPVYEEYKNFGRDYKKKK